MNRAVLLVTPDIDACKGIVQIFCTHGYELQHVATCSNAYAVVNSDRTRFGIIVICGLYEKEDEDAPWLADGLRRCAPEVPVFIMIPGKSLPAPEVIDDDAVLVRGADEAAMAAMILGLLKSTHTH